MHLNEIVCRTSMSPLPFDGSLPHNDLDWNLDLGDGEKLDLFCLLQGTGDVIDLCQEESSLVEEDSSHVESAESGQKKRCFDLVRGPSRRTGKKKAKGMPKRPLSAYNVFFQTERPIIFDESDQRIGFEELGKVIGQRWRSLSDQERRKYEQIADKDVARYRKEMDAYEEMRRQRIRPSAAGSAHIQAFSSYVPTPDTTRSTTPDHLVSILSSSEIIVTPVVSPGAQSTSSSGRVTPTPNAVSPSPIPVFSHPPPAPLSYLKTEPKNSTEHTTIPLGMQLPIPPGMEFILTDEHGRESRYMVQYTCYRMSRAAADDYISRMTEASASPPVAATS
jgi:HMG (high mobility group) box